MNKFSKSSDHVTLEPLADEEAADMVLSAMAGNDPLVFVARTNNGYPHRVDLTRYRDGSAELGLIGVPDMIADLLPVIRREIGDGTRSREGIQQWLHRNLPVFFGWIAWISVEIGPERAPKNVADFTHADGALLKRYLLGLGGDLRRRRNQLSAILRLIVKARGSDDAPLLWPTIEVDEDRRAHVDVDPDAVKYLYHACKRVIDAAMRNQERGRVWLETGVDPREDPNPWGKRNQLGVRGGIRNPVWYAPGNLAVLGRACVEDRILGTSAVDKRTLSTLRNHTCSGYDRFAGVSLRDLYAAIAPTPLEVAASALIVSMETGWIDTVDGIDLTSEWFILRRGVDPDAARKLDSVVLQVIRPKTGRMVRAIGQAGPRFRAFQVIRWMQGRSGLLRELLTRRRALLEAQPDSLATRQELAAIAQKLRTPWLWYQEYGRGCAAAGGTDLSHLIHTQIVALKRIAVEFIPENRPNREKLIAAIESLRWSDVRDAFATHVYDNSGQNIFLVQRALSHADPFTTRRYLRQRRQLRERFDAFRSVMETALREVRDGRPMDPTILYLASNFRDFGEADRERLKRYRTQMGMGCANPTDPETFLAPTHPKGALCVIQRCVLCRHGIVFADAFEGLADRHADLLRLRDTTLPDRWMTSTFWWEFEAIKLLLTDVFAGKRAEFMERSDARLAGLRADRYSLFDDPETARGGI
jgi:hypothetical protein